MLALQYTVCCGHMTDVHQSTYTWLLCQEVPHCEYELKASRLCKRCVLPPVVPRISCGDPGLWALTPVFT